MLTGIDFSHVGSFTVDATIGEDSYTYVFQLCGDAGGVAGAGVIQVDKKSPKTVTVIGQYNSTKAIGGSKNLQNMFFFKFSFHHSNFVLIKCGILSL